jgi:hypothetical protein
MLHPANPIKISLPHHSGHPSALGGTTQCSPSTGKQLKMVFPNGQ